MLKWTLTLLCLATTALVAVLAQGAGRILVQVAGVCNPDPYGIKCFTNSGVVDPKLTKEIRDFFESHPEDPLRLEYRHRDKLIVVRHDKRQDLDADIAHSFLLADGKSFPAMIRVPRRPADEYATDLYWYYPPAAETTITASYLSKRQLPTVTIDARVGANASFGPYTMTITSIAALGSIDAAHDRPKWMIEYRLSGVNMKDLTFSADTELVGKNGDVIRAVDRGGRPSTTAADSPSQGVGLAAPIHGGWASLADPSEVGKLLVRPTVTIPTQFTFALGPY